MTPPMTLSAFIMRSTIVDNRHDSDGEADPYGILGFALKLRPYGSQQHITKLPFCCLF
jgi:hypothetical protein